MARKKINVGDWVIGCRGTVFQVEDLDHEGWDGTNMEFVSDMTKLPASPATLAKSHRLLMRWFDAYWKGDVDNETRAAVSRHCRRIAKGGKPK